MSPTFASIIAREMPLIASPLSPSHQPQRPTPHGVYVHVPFCTQKCIYCDFYSFIPASYPSEYANHIIRELDLAGDAFEGPVASVYFGGGTPSLLREGDVARVLEAVLTRYAHRDVPEITFECNPDDASLDYFRAIHQAGVNRLSIGIQSLSPRLLNLLGRKHSALQAVEAVNMAREAGFSNISVDVIYGIPSQTGEELSETLTALLRLKPEHVSAYHLTREPGTRYDYACRSRKMTEVEDEVSQWHFHLVRHALVDAGYEHYEVSNFAFPHRQAVHNGNYWSGLPYLGLGPGAHSFDGGHRRWWAVANYREYAAALGHHELPYTREELTPEEQFSEWLLTRLRTAQGLNLAAGARRYGPEAMQRLRQRAEPWLHRGILHRRDEWLAMEPEHFLLTDAVILSLMP